MFSIYFLRKPFTQHPGGSERIEILPAILWRNGAVRNFSKFFKSQFFNFEFFKSSFIFIIYRLLLVGVDNPSVWQCLTKFDRSQNHKKITDGWSETFQPLLYWGLVIIYAVLPWVVDHSCLVHLNFRGGSPIRRVSHPSPYGVVVETQVVLAAVDRHRSRASVVRIMTTRVQGGSANHPGWAECLWLVTVGVSFWFGDYLLGNL